MQCSEAHEWLQRYLDGETLPERDALDPHWNLCPECRERFSAARRLREGLGRLGSPSPPAGLADQIIANSQKDRLRRIYRRRIIALSAVAAGMLVAIVVGLYRPGSEDESQSFWDRMAELFSPSPRVLYVGGGGSMSIGPDLPPEAPESPPSLRESVADASSAVASLTRRTADETVGQGSVLLPEKLPMPPQPEPGASDIEPAARSLREAQAGATAGLEPVTNSARRAFSLFLRGIPTPKPDTEE